MSLLMDALQKAEDEKKRAEAAVNLPKGEGEVVLTGEVAEPVTTDPNPRVEPVAFPLDRSEEPTIESGEQQNSMELMLEPLSPEQRSEALELLLVSGPSKTHSIRNEPLTDPAPATRTTKPATLDATLIGARGNDATRAYTTLQFESKQSAQIEAEASASPVEFGELTRRVTANTVFEAGGVAGHSSILRLGGMVLGSVLAALVGVGLYFERNLSSSAGLSPPAGLPTMVLPKVQPSVVAVLPTVQPLPTATPVPVPEPTAVPGVAASPDPGAQPGPVATPPVQESAAEPAVPVSIPPPQGDVLMQEAARVEAPVPTQRRARYAPEQRTIEVARGPLRASPFSLVQEAYSAYRRGEFQRAESLYQDALHLSPDNRDALLGMGAIRMHHGLREQAIEYYRQVLELDPKDPVASAALVSLAATGGEEDDEAHLQGLIQQHGETPELQFSLGNLYARKARWADAQQAYFAAVAGDPRNADYAFNLAVSLERLGQTKAALPYYEKALALTRIRAGGFDPGQATARVQALRHVHGE